MPGSTGLPFLTAYFGFIYLHWGKIYRGKR